MARGRSSSPFSRPNAGDVLRIPETGLYWVVESAMHEDVDYFVTPDPSHVDHVAVRTITRKSWMELCCRFKAEFVTGRVQR